MTIQIHQNVPLASFTTLGVGGLARLFAKAETENDIADAVKYASEEKLNLFVLGGGSNVLVSDDGFHGLVLQIVPKGISFTEDSDSIVRVTAAAGVGWDDLVSQCVSRDLAGIECLSGIPGLVGGTPVQNVGAYGQEVSETIETVRCFDRTTKSFVDLTNEECGFSYRTSIVNSAERERYIVTSVIYSLRKGGLPKIAYKDLKEFFAGREPSLAETRNAVLQIRKAKSMVIDPGDPNSRSAGSFFKNPIVPKVVADKIAENLAIEKTPQFPFDSENVKIPAAWLIEKAGFHKGFRLGNAGISENHSLAIVNLGNAMAAEIVALKELIQSGVAEKFGIRLIPEPIFVGF